MHFLFCCATAFDVNQAKCVPKGAKTTQELTSVAAVSRLCHIKLQNMQSLTYRGTKEVRSLRPCDQQEVTVGILQRNTMQRGPSYALRQMHAPFDRQLSLEQTKNILEAGGTQRENLGHLTSQTPQFFWHNLA